VKGKKPNIEYRTKNIEKDEGREAKIKKTLDVRREEKGCL